MFGLYPDPLAEIEPPSVSDTYRQILQTHAEGHINRVIEGETFEDAILAYEQMFLAARRRVQIVTNTLIPEIFDKEAEMKHS